MEQFSIKYKKGSKYQLAETVVVNIGLTGYIVTDKYYTLSTNGELVILEGYVWDGPSGPAIDTPNFMPGSLVHDVLYEMLRKGQLPQRFRSRIDNILDLINKANKMTWIRRWWVKRAVRKFAASAADPKNKRKIYTAP